MISGKRVIAAMLTTLMAVTFTANTAECICDRGNGYGECTDHRCTEYRCAGTDTGRTKGSGIAAGL